MPRLDRGARSPAVGPPVLLLHGTCRFSTAGFSGKLRRQGHNGINPHDVLLSRIVHLPSGPVTYAPTPEQAFSLNVDGFRGLPLSRLARPPPGRLDE
jgi:hypothetical protein